MFLYFLFVFVCLFANDCMTVALNVLPFVTMFEDVLPRSVVKHMRREAEVVGPLITGSWWLSKESYRLNNARNFAEHAMLLMKPFIFRELGIDDSTTNFVGAEYWYKVVRPPNKVEFHTDKDESLTFQHDSRQLRQPLCVVILYLDNVGGPTALLDISGSSNISWTPEKPQFVNRSVLKNQTPLFQYNANSPLCFCLLKKVAISLPKENKAMMFNGSKIHAVLKDPKKSGTRVTFIHNLWLEQRP
jgi:hypothetical protein